MEQAGNEEPKPRLAFGIDVRRDQQQIDLAQRIGRANERVARLAGDQFDLRPGLLEQAIRFDQRQRRAVGRTAGFERIDADVVQIGLARVTARPRRSSAGAAPVADSQFDDAAELFVENRAIDGPIGSRLGPMREIKSLPTAGRLQSYPPWQPCDREWMSVPQVLFVISSKRSLTRRVALLEKSSSVVFVLIEGICTAGLFQQWHPNRGEVLDFALSAHT